jgi:hypothetical protein
MSASEHFHLAIEMCERTLETFGFGWYGVTLLLRTLELVPVRSIQRCCVNVARECASE